MLIAGLILIVLGLVGGALLVDVVLADPLAGDVSLDVVGIPFEATGGSLLAATALLAVLATLLVAVGYSMIATSRAEQGRGKRKQRDTEPEATRELRQITETRLWQVRLEGLRERVGELEKQNERLLEERGMLEEHMTVHRIVGDDGQTEALVVLPDLETAEPEDER